MNAPAIPLAFTLDGTEIRLDVPPDRRLLTLLREDLSQTGTKIGCGIGRCGACMVLLDGRAVNACLLMAWQVQGKQVTTIEGLHQTASFAPLFAALAEANAFQCGYCAPGIAIALAGLFAEAPEADDEALLTALEGNICRCTGYHSILRGARLAAERLRAARPATSPAR
jgi:carbon-monoxide dehydrogenase small subunit